MPPRQPNRGTAGAVRRGGRLTGRSIAPEIVKLVRHFVLVENPAALVERDHECRRACGTNATRLHEKKCTGGNCGEGHVRCPVDWINDNVTRTADLYSSGSEIREVVVGIRRDR